MQIINAYYLHFSMITRVVVLVLWAALMTVSTTAMAQSLTLATAEKLFSQAGDGDSEAVERALQMYKRLQQQQPDHPLIMVKIGSLTTMQARHAWMPWNKMRYAESGMDIIDKALERLREGSAPEQGGEIPTALRVKLTAAATFSAVPKFFNRYGQAGRLFKDIVDDTSFAETPPTFQARTWLYKAALAEKREKTADYLDALKKASRADPDGVTGDQARSLLMEQSHD